MLCPIGIVFGTRPEYLKVKPLFKALERQNLEFRILHVGQHIDLRVEEETHQWYRKIGIDPVQGVSRLTELASSLPTGIEPFIQECQSILVQGDTATAFFAALTAFHLKKPIFHLEAGLRTYDLENPFPEEAYRSMISRIATYHLCPDQSAKTNLEKEMVTKGVTVVGNTILDLVRSYGFESRIEPKILVTVHRRENWSCMKQIVKSICEVARSYPAYRFTWVLHPNPTLQEEVRAMLSQESLSNLEAVQPMNHKDLCREIASSACMITDSGGIQEEASFLGKLCFVLRKVTERSAIPSQYIRIVEDPSGLGYLFEKERVCLLEPCHVYGDGHAVEKILTLLLKDKV